MVWSIPKVNRKLVSCRMKDIFVDSRCAVAQWKIRSMVGRGSFKDIIYKTKRVYLNSGARDSCESTEDRHDTCQECRKMRDDKLEKHHLTGGFERWSALYQRRASVVCCIKPGEIDDGGLATVMPVLGLTIGMAFRVRTADGWWILSW